jgi:hypothetical protein
MIRTNTVMTTHNCCLELPYDFERLVGNPEIGNPLFDRHN